MEGTVDITLQETTETISVGQISPLIISVEFKNNREEPVQFYGDPAKAFAFTFTPTEEEGTSWAPAIRGLCDGRDIFAEVIVIPGGESRIVNFISVGSSPTEAGSLDGIFDNYRVNGIQSGDLIPVSGVPLSFGPITVQDATAS